MLTRQQRYDIYVKLIELLSPYLSYSNPIMQKLYRETLFSPAISDRYEQEFLDLLSEDMLKYGNVNKSEPHHKEPQWQDTLKNH